MNFSDQVIIALDYENPEEAFRLVDALERQINCFKVGPQLFTRSGPEILQYLHKKKKQIFVDLKLHDTPMVVANTIRQLAELGVHYATVHCLGGSRMLEAASQGCRGSRLKLLGVSLLTSFESLEAKDWGWNGSCDDWILRFCDTAQKARLSGILCSAQEAKMLKARITPGFLLVTPGIRIPNKEVFQDDQRRVASPKEAIDAGADFLIVGRPVTQARDPKLAVAQLFHEFHASN